MFLSANGSSSSSSSDKYEPCLCWAVGLGFDGSGGGIGGAEKAGFEAGRGGGVALGDELMLRPAMSGCSARAGGDEASLAASSSFPFIAATRKGIGVSLRVQTNARFWGFVRKV